MKSTWRGVDEDTGRHDPEAIVSVSAESWLGRRLVRVGVQEHAGNGGNAHAYLSTDTAKDVGHAIVSAAYGQPTDDTVERWDHALPLPDGFVDAVMGELESPRATSLGHKRTIYACRILADELMRLRKDGNS